MWYVIQVKTGEEVAVRSKLQELGIHSCVPLENRPIRSSGSWKQKEYVLFSGYVFLTINFTAENYYKVKGMPNVIRFLGESNRPTPLTYLEAEWITVLSGNGEVLSPSRVKENENGTLDVIEGVLTKFANRIIKIDKHGRKATFEITINNEVKEVTLGIELVEDKKFLEEMG